MKKILLTLAAATVLALTYQVSQADIASHLCVPSIGCLTGDNANVFVDEDGDGVLDTAESNLTINAPDADGDETVQGTLTVVGTSDFQDAVTATSITVSPSTTPTVGFDDSDDGGNTDAQIIANCPTAGDCDLSFLAEAAGTPTEVFRIDTTDAAVQSLFFSVPTLSSNGDFNIQLDADANGSNQFQVLNSAGIAAINVTEGGLLTIGGNDAAMSWDDTAFADGTSETLLRALTTADDNGGFQVSVESGSAGTYIGMITVGSTAGASTVYLGGVTDGSLPTTNALTVDESGVMASLSGGAINLTGTINGAVTTVVNSADTADTLGVTNANELYGNWMIYSNAGTVTVTLPANAAGMNVCIYDAETTQALVINPDDADVIVLNGTALSAGDSITSAGDAGDFICLIAPNTTNWYTLGRSGAWTDTN